MATMARLRACIAPGSSVLDVGGAVVQPTHASYRTLFKDCRYTSLDFAGADINVTGYDWPIADGAFDAVISGQALEHDGMFWRTMTNVARVLRPGGHAILIVPSAGEVHRHPVDCYRFYPDSMAALAEWSNLQLVTTDWDLSGANQWRDLAGVFRKPEGI
jgi:SAM-dependent methyltransferase